MSTTDRFRLGFGALILSLAVATGCTEKLVPPTGPQPVPVLVTPDSIQNIFTANCVSCHVGTNPPAGLDLSADQSYEDLIGALSLNCSADFGTPILRVKPGVPDSSCLIIAITVGLNDWGQMPLGGPSLPADTVSKIRSWIQQGAPATVVVTAF